MQLNEINNRMEYIKRNTVEAFVWDNQDSTIKEIEKWGSIAMKDNLLEILTDDGSFLQLKTGDYIVKSVDGTFKCSKDYFEKAYEKITK